MGPDGKPLRGAALPPSLDKNNPVAKWLWVLNLLAVFVLAAFTIRKFLLRRQSAVGGATAP
jgi:hypothetical protein